MTTAPKIRILIADDHGLVRDGIIALLKSERDIIVSGEAKNGVEAIDKVKELNPSIVLMDLSMPEMDGIEATRRIVKDFPATRVIALTQHDQEEYVKRVVAAGASGYILKNALAADLMNAIRTVSKGGKFFDPGVNRVMAEAYLKIAAGVRQEKTSLTKRELEILQSIARGNTNQQTANKLHLSVRTVEFHRANILQKLGFHDTPSLVKYAISEKIITL